MSHSGRHRRNLRNYVYARDRARCWLCMMLIRLEDFTLDHVIPRSMGGLAMRQNLRASHRWCNEERANKVGGLDLSPVKSPFKITLIDHPGCSR